MAPQTATPRIRDSNSFRRNTLKSIVMPILKPKKKDLTPKNSTKLTHAMIICRTRTLGNRFFTVSLSIARPLRSNKIATKQQSNKGVAMAPIFSASELREI